VYFWPRERARERASLVGREFAMYFWPVFGIVHTAMMHVSCRTGPFGELCTGSEFALQDSLTISWFVESCAYVQCCKWARFMDPLLAEANQAWVALFSLRRAVCRGTLSVKSILNGRQLGKANNAVYEEQECGKQAIRYQLAHGVFDVSLDC